MRTISAVATLGDAMRQAQIQKLSVGELFCIIEDGSRLRGGRDGAQRTRRLETGGVRSAGAEGHRMESS